MRIVKTLIVDWLGQRFDNLGWRATALRPTLALDTRILLLQLDGKLGDSVQLSGLLEPLRRRFPAGRLAIATTSGFERFWASNPLVNQVLVVPSRGATKLRLWTLWRRLRRAQGAYDVCVLFEPFVTVDSLLAVRAVGARFNIGFIKEHYRLFHVSLHDHTFHWRKRPIDSRVRELLAVLGAEEDAILRGYTGLAEEGRAEAGRIIGDVPETRVFLNAFGTAPEACFDQSHLLQIVDGLLSGSFGDNVAVFLNLPLNYPAAQLAELLALGSQGKRVVRLPYPMQLPALFSVIAGMQLVISPDTGIVHMAAALDVPQVAVYPEMAFKGTVWRAQSTRACILAPDADTNVNDVPVDRILAGALAMLDNSHHGSRMA